MCARRSWTARSTSSGRRPWRCRRDGRRAPGLREHARSRARRRRSRLQDARPERPLAVATTSLPLAPAGERPGNAGKRLTKVGGRDRRGQPCRPCRSPSGSVWTRQAQTAFERVPSQGTAPEVLETMMRWTIVVPSWVLGTILTLQSSVQAQTGDSQSPASMERIRAALKQPPPLLRVPAPSVDRPTFRIEVRERPFVLRPTDEEPFDPTFGLPSVGELLMDGVDKIRSAAVDYKRRRAGRRARREVDDSIAAFCAVRECPAPDAGR